MTEFELETPRAQRDVDVRVDFEVAEDASLPHHAWTRYAAIVHGGAYPHLGFRRWSTTATNLDSVSEEAATTGVSESGSSALVDLRPDGVEAWTYLYLARGSVGVSVAAVTPGDREAAQAWVQSRIPLAEPVDLVIPVQFWARDACATTRTLAVPPWSDIAGNYPAAARDALDALVAAPPRGHGRLLLWHGPPGTGKTHVVRALGWEWREWCSVHYVTDPEDFFGSSRYMLEVLLDEDADDEDERWRLLVLEDTGELLSADAKERTGQGLSRFLNVCDGIIGQGLRVLVLVTTNELLRRLHPAVSRPGRCAAAIEIGAFPADEADAWLAARGLDPAGVALTLAELYARAEGRVADEPRAPVGF
jgi:hypothetical protein